MQYVKTICVILCIATFSSCSGKGTENKLNRLANELSPYLLQHADNPVDWFPWGKEAFAKAHAEDKPIFLSIGYSTCHWCHVMEHESFEDDSVAKLLNDWFISIKVDREELPEIDHVYMSVCQAMTGSGGWPLTIIMTPDKEPFFAGTYFPKNRRGNRPGMLQLLPMIHDSWTNKRADILKSVAQVKSYLIRSNTRELGDEINETILETAYDDFVKRFDKKMGGFGRAPKFPSPHNLIYLLRYYYNTKNQNALLMVESTLKNMRLGGIFDHVGFGFHRYSTDKKWLVPHFEKMLYDQAMLAMAYSEAYQITKNEFYARTTREIFTYVLRDMTSPSGGFYSAEDADSEGEEGKFYVWTNKEIIDILGEEDGVTYNTIFNVNTNGNFHDEVSGRETGNNILHLQKRINTIAENMDITPETLHETIEEWRQKLFAVREKRIHPLKDDKILTDWNGLMIAALAKGSIALDEPSYAQAAQKAADFILSKLKTDGGRLLKRHRNGESSLDAHLDDYAFMIWGLLELYEANFNTANLAAAIELTEIMVEDFWNDEAGGFYLGADHAEKLIVRSMTSYDGAIPSGNSVAVGVLNRLARITGNMDLLDKADKTLRTFEKDLNRIPSSHTHMLTGYMFGLDAKEVVVVGDHSTETQTFLQSISHSYNPNRVIIFKEINKTNLSKLAPWTETQTMLENKPTAYVCKNFACNQPTNNLKLALKQLEE
ncbi:MAG: thioredoxin domain-containing protein [Candidatus Marinimicrobia bacterium]|nr:thioredoxin domain-containing protein [Candidatus Neomarinimicrobiota bacterium]